MAVFDNLVGGLQSQNLLYAMLPLLVVYLAVIIVAIILVFFMYRKRHELDYRTAMKSGIFTFVIILVANIILTNIFVIGMPGVVVGYDYYFTTGIVSALIGGAFWGSVYLYFYSRIPGSTSTKKSFFLGSIIILLPMLIGILIRLSYASIQPIDFFEYKDLILEPIVSYVIFGCFLGYFWNRYKSPRPNSAPTGSPSKQ